MSGSSQKAVKSGRTQVSLSLQDPAKTSSGHPKYASWGRPIEENKTSAGKELPANTFYKIKTSGSFQKTITFFENETIVFLKRLKN